jgi:tetratricopeptide (TPR) repeat protein
MAFARRKGTCAPPRLAGARLLVAICATLLVACAGLTVGHAQGTGTADYDVRLERGVELFAGASYEEAAVVFGNLTKSAPDRKEAHFWLGRSLARVEKWTAAREALRRYVELAPGDSDGPREMARSYESVDNRELAVFWYKKVLDIAPDDRASVDALRRLDQAQAEIAAPAAASSGSSPAAPPQPEVGVAAPEGARTRPAGFWGQGLAGLLGARSVWWGRALAVFIFVMPIINTTFTGSEMRRRIPTAPAGFLVAIQIPIFLFYYVFFWGLPQGPGDWILAAACALAQALVLRRALA